MTDNTRKHADATEISQWYGAPEVTLENYKDFLDSESNAQKYTAMAFERHIREGWLNPNTGKGQPMQPTATEAADKRDEDRAKQDAKDAWAEYDRKKKVNDKNPKNPPHPSLKQPDVPRPSMSRPQADLLEDAANRDTAMAARGPAANIGRFDPKRFWSDLEKLSPKQRKALATELRGMGIDAPEKGTVSLAFVNAMVEFEKQYAQAQAYGFKGSREEFRQQEIEAGGGTGTGYTGPVTTTDLSVQTFNASQLKDAVNAAFEKAVGRRATAKELKAAVMAVNKQAEKNPDKTVTVTTGSGTPTQTRKSKTSGGFDPTTTLQNQAERDPEFGNFQAATTYYDAMLQAIRSPVGQGA